MQKHLHFPPSFLYQMLMRIVIPPHIADRHLADCTKNPRFRIDSLSKICYHKASSFCSFCRHRRDSIEQTEKAEENGTGAQAGCRTASGRAQKAGRPYHLHHDGCDSGCRGRILRRVHVPVIYFRPIQPMTGDISCPLFGKYSPPFDERI